MLQAVQAPVVKLIALAATGIVALGAVPSRSADGPIVQRLVLHAPEEPGALYLTAWDEGAIEVTLEGTTPQRITFEVRANISDGCKWLGTERLTPIDDHTYAYSYDETILSCEPGAEPFRKTPRTGIVTVE